MATEEARIARRWFTEVWQERNASTIDELMDPAAIGHTSAGDITGPAEWKERVWDPLTTAFPKMSLDIEDIVSKDETAMVRWRATMVHTGPGLGLAPSGRTVVLAGLTWLTIRGGRIVEGWDGWDFTGMLVQCGATVKADPQS
jgi:predicted ester cyclase